MSYPKFLLTQEDLAVRQAQSQFTPWPYPLFSPLTLKTELQGPRVEIFPYEMEQPDMSSVVGDGSAVMEFLQDFSMTTTDNQRSCS